MFKQSGLNSILTITQTTLRQQAFNLCKGKVCLQVCSFPWGSTELKEAHFIIKYWFSTERPDLFLLSLLDLTCQGSPKEAHTVSLTVTCFNEHTGHLCRSVGITHPPQGTVWACLLCSTFLLGNKNQAIWYFSCPRLLYETLLQTHTKELSSVWIMYLSRLPLASFTLVSKSLIFIACCHLPACDTCGLMQNLLLI